MAYTHVGTKYIKIPWDFENFLEFWCTLLPNYHSVKQSSENEALQLKSPFEWSKWSCCPGLTSRTWIDRTLTEIICCDFHRRALAIEERAILCSVITLPSYFHLWWQREILEIHITNTWPPLCFLWLKRPTKEPPSTEGPPPTKGAKAAWIVFLKVFSLTWYLSLGLSRLSSVSRFCLSG